VTIGRDAHQAEIEVFMQRKFVLFRWPIVLLLALAGVMAACSKSDKGTNPMPTTEPFESGDLASNAAKTFVHIFNTSGSFGYRCRHHSSMTGTIVVTAGAGDSVVVSIGDLFFNPSSATIKPGGYARWITGTTTLHTVTRP